MQTLTNAFMKALRDLMAPGLFRLFMFSVLLTLGVLIVFVFSTSHFLIWLMGDTGSAWFSFLTGIGATIIAFFMFPLVLPIIVSFFDEATAACIERFEYPALPVGTSQPFWPELWQDIRFSLWATFLNIVCLPFYLVPGLNLILFYLLNGYLLGRYFFMMAGGRHVGKREARLIGQRHRFIIWIAGIVIAFMATLPIVNLIAPFWGIAVMVHLYHMLAPRQVLLTV